MVIIYFPYRCPLSLSLISKHLSLYLISKHLSLYLISKHLAIFSLNEEDANLLIPQLFEMVSILTSIS